MCSDVATPWTGDSWLGKVSAQCFGLWGLVITGAVRLQGVEESAGAALLLDVYAHLTGLLLDTCIAREAPAEVALVALHVTAFQLERVVAEGARKAGAAVADARNAALVESKRTAWVATRPAKSAGAGGVRTRSSIPGGNCAGERGVGTEALAAPAQPQRTVVHARSEAQPVVVFDAPDAAESLLRARRAAHSGAENVQR